MGTPSFRVRVLAVATAVACAAALCVSAVPAASKTKPVCFASLFVKSAKASKKALRTAGFNIRCRTRLRSFTATVSKPLKSVARRALVFKLKGGTERKAKGERMTCAFKKRGHSKRSKIFVCKGKDRKGHILVGSFKAKKAPIACRLRVKITAVTAKGKRLKLVARKCFGG